MSEHLTESFGKLSGHLELQGKRLNMAESKIIQNENDTFEITNNNMMLEKRTIHIRE
jgi:hypothetical protein